MKSGEKKTIGIVGGMGPMATVELFHKIVSLTDAKCDSEHIRIIIDNRPQIPDRTRALTEGGESPVPMIVESANSLAMAGADFLVIPCNTSHAFYSLLTESISIPILNMIEETAKYIIANSIRRVGLFATDGTIATGVYSTVFSKYGIELVLPDEDEQKAVIEMIYSGVKAANRSFDASHFQNVIHSMEKKNVDAIVLGCTELPLGVKMYGLKGRFIDPGIILAKAAIENAGYRYVVGEEANAL